MDQLEVFREQLRRKPGETQKKEMKKKKEGSDATVKVPAATLRDARVLALWLDERGKRRSLSFIFADALEYYIDNRYPEAREGVRIVKKQEE